jgi:hypothetical protein
MSTDIEIRECTTLAEFAECVQVQREVFALPETELSPVRHLVVTKTQEATRSVPGTAAGSQGLR